MSFLKRLFGKTSTIVEEKVVEPILGNDRNALSDDIYAQVKTLSIEGDGWAENQNYTAAIHTVWLGTYYPNQKIIGMHQLGSSPL